MIELLFCVTWLCILLVIYHHAIFPLMIRLLGRNASPLPSVKKRAFNATHDESRPSIGVLIPCYNEADVIADKLINLASQDYPSNKLKVYIVCDGCQDDTASIARQTADHPLCKDLNIAVIEHKENRGKLACLNECVPLMEEELLALTDTSALLSLDALLVGSEHFKSSDVGALSGRYEFLESGGDGQAAYWRYQIFIKQKEDAMGSTLGAHGACYIMRRALYKAPEADTINDDFVIPMYVIEQGFRVRYEPRIVALELERLHERKEASRRERISMGNVQQAVRLAHMMHPRYGHVAFNYASGKVLRAFMPVLLLLSLIGSLVLALYLPWMWFIAGGQLLGYGAALWHHLFPNHPNIAPLRIIHYIVAGHAAGSVGLYRYFFNRRSLVWR